MTHSPIITGLLAYGMSGKVFHAPFLQVNPGFELRAVVERTKKNAAADVPGIISYDSIDALLADPEIELVIVNTPNYLHYEHTKAALLAGKHVLVEKPFTATVAEAKELFDLGKQEGRKVMVYQNRRYSSDFLATKKVIGSGKLGRLIEAHFRFDRYKNEIGPKKFKEEPFPAAGIVYDLGSHLLDQVISIFGKPVSWHKTTGQYRDGSPVDDFGHIHLIYPNQVNVFVTVSMLTMDPLPGIVLHGNKGTFIKPFADVQEAQSIKGILPDHPQFGVEEKGKEGTLTYIDAEGKKQTESIPGEKGNMMSVFDAAFETIRNDQDFPVKEEDIMVQLGMLEKG